MNDMKALQHSLFVRPQCDGCVLATYHGAMDLDFDVFMIKHALISPDSSLTQAVEAICETVSYSAMRLILENAQK